MDQRDKQNVAVLAAVAVIVALALWLLHVAADNIKMQNCVFSGRRDCNPIPMDSQ